MRPLIAAAAWAAVLAGALPSAAQTPAASLRPGRIVVALGGAWIGGESLGAVRAETRAAAAGTTTPPPFALFTTTSRLDAAPAIDASLAVAVTRGWAVEVRGGVRRPTLTTTISDDTEAAGTFTASEEIAEYVVDASVLYHPAWGAIGSRTRGYLVAGGGYLRQLHEDRVLVETGATLHVGAGARLWLVGGRGPGVAAGLTSDLRWVVRRDGITFRDGARSLPAWSLRAFVGF